MREKKWKTEFRYQQRREQRTMFGRLLPHRKQQGDSFDNYTENKYVENNVDEWDIDDWEKELNLAKETSNKYYIRYSIELNTKIINKLYKALLQ